MLNTQFVQTVENLALKERLALLEILARSVQQDLFPQSSSEKKGASLRRVLGALRSEGKSAPADEEIKKDYIDYLIRKYA